jgi:epoxide hydrolase 4
MPRSRLPAAPGARPGTAMRKLTVRANEIDLYLRAVGDANAPLIRFLHGFPEYSGAWRRSCPPSPTGLMRWRRTRGATPSQASPGGLSHQAIAARRARLADRLSPHRPFSIVAHDGGCRRRLCDRDRRPQACGKAGGAQRRAPWPLSQRALLEAEAQRAAGAYIHELRHPQAEAKLSANRYEKLLGMLSRFGPQALADARQSGRLPRSPARVP